jgi:general secretion pathway protein G
MQAKRGFTLVEILIVVVILGILAAIVVPQFTQASTEAKTNSLCSNLQSLRSQIQLFKVQHNDTPPNAATFESEMVYCTDIDLANAATPSKERTATYEFGPYLERVPDNPFTSDSTVADADGAAPAAGAAGWLYDEDTGEIYAAPDTTADTLAHEAL